MAKKQTKKQEVTLTVEEMDRIQLFRNNFNDLRARLGDNLLKRKVTENQLNSLQNKEQELLNEYSLIQQNQTNLFKELNDKYGEGEVDINTGVFTPSE